MSQSIDQMTLSNREFIRALLAIFTFLKHKRRDARTHISYGRSLFFPFRQHLALPWPPPRGVDGQQPRKPPTPFGWSLIWRRSRFISIYLILRQTNLVVTETQVSQREKKSNPSRKNNCFDWRNRRIVQRNGKTGGDTGANGKSERMAQHTSRFFFNILF